MRSWLMVAALAVALLAPNGQAALNGDHDFAVQVPYPTDLGAGYTGDITILSGSLSASMAGSVDPMLFFNVTAGGITGLTKVCWSAPVFDCRQDANGGIALTWQPGSSVALKFPTPARGDATADHALVFFVDPRQTISFGGVVLNFGKLMGAGAVGGQFTFGALADIPNTVVQDLSANNAAGLLALDDRTVITVNGGGSTATFRAAHDSLTFQGKPTIASFGAEGIVLPFASGDLTMGGADADAARRGIEGTGLEDLQARILTATGGQGAPFDTTGMRATLHQYLQGLEVPIMNGALLTMPTDFSDSRAALDAMTLIRFDSLAASGGEAVAVTGDGPLVVQGGQVQFAPALVGFAYFQLPWWSYLLWALAIAALITRVARGEKAPKTNERWDRLKWVGWVAGPVAFLIFFLLWDNEVRTIFGVSLLSGAGGAGFLMVALLELLPMGIVFGAVVTPLRILFRNGLRLGNQGSFMGLSGPTATLLGFLFGATLLLSYFNVVLSQF